MTKELVCSISIFVIMLIEPISWFFFCGKIQYQKTFKRNNKILSLLGLLVLFLITKLLSEILNKYALVSFLFQNSVLIYYYLYATRIFGMDTKIAVSFLSIFNISCTLLEYIYTFIVLFVFRSVTPEYALQPNPFRVLCFFILSLSKINIL